MGGGITVWLKDLPKIGMGTNMLTYSEHGMINCFGMIFQMMSYLGGIVNYLNPFLVPVTEAWRDELRALTEAIGVSNNNLPKISDGRPLKPTTSDGHRSRMATVGEGGRPRTTQYSANTGRLIPPPSRAMSRQVGR